VGPGEARVVVVRRVRVSEHASEGTLSGTLPREVARTRRAMTKEGSRAMTKEESPAMTEGESRAMAKEEKERAHHIRTRFM
jgi:hypothetical protein